MAIAFPTGRRSSVMGFGLAAGGTAISLGCALARELVTADRFGASAELGTFLLVFLAAVMLPVLIGETLSAVLPAALYSAEGRAGEELLGSLLLTSVGAMALLGGMLALTAEHVIPLWAPGLSAAQLDQAVHYMRLLAPTLAVQVVIELFKAILNSARFFGPPTLSQTLPALSVSAAVAIFGASHGVSTLIWGWWVGLALQVAALAWAVRWAGIRIRVRFAGPPVWRVLREASTYLVVPASAAAFFMIDRAFASTEGAGGAASASYAEKLFRLPWLTLSAALVSVTGPLLSQRVLDRGLEGLSSALRTSLRVALLLTVPSAVLLFLLAEPAVRIVLQRGAFSAHDTSLSAVWLGGYATVLVLLTCVQILDRGLCALRRGAWIAAAAIAGLAVKTLLGFVLYQRYGLQGVAFSTAPALLAQAGVMSLALRAAGVSVLPRPLPGGRWRRHLVEAGAVLATCVFAGALIEPLRDRAGVGLTDLHPTNFVLLAVTAATALGVMGAALRYRQQVLQGALQRPFLIALLLLCPLSVLWSFDPTRTLARGLHMSVLGGLALVMARCLSARQRMRVVVGSLALMVIASVVVVVVWPDFGRMTDDYHLGRWRGVFPHKTNLGTTAVLLLLACVAAVPTARVRWPWVALGLLGAVAALASGSMGALLAGLGALAALGAVLLWRRIRRAPRARLAVLSGTLMVTLLLGALLLWPNALLELLGRRHTLEARLDLWALLLPAIAERPLLGYGFEGFWFSLRSGAQQVVDAYGLHPFYAHNLAVELLLHLGVVGLILFAVQLWRTARGALLDVTRDPGPHLWPLLSIAYFCLRAPVEVPGMASYGPESTVWLLYLLIAFAPREARASS